MKKKMNFVVYVYPKQALIFDLLLDTRMLITSMDACTQWHVLHLKQNFDVGYFGFRMAYYCN